VIVLDASVGLELLLQLDDAERIMERVLGRGDSLHAPQLFDVEVTQVVRRYWRHGEVSVARAGVAIADLQELPIVRHEHTALLNRVWQLRDDATAYDAVYIALAEALQCPLVTRDRALARIPRLRTAVELL
jgi:predicted nucleic acid-binding protein